MNQRTVVLLVTFGLLAIFVAFNWSALLAPTSLWLGVTSVQAPLGLILLGFIALLSAMFLAYVIYFQGAALLESRRHARDVATLGEQVKALEERLGTKIGTIEANAGAAQGRLLERLDKLDRDFGAAMERTEAAMAAYVGELSDRIGPRRPPET